MAGVNKSRGNTVKTTVQERKIVTRRATLTASNANTKRVAEKSPGGLAKKRNVLTNLANTLYSGAATSLQSKKIAVSKDQENQEPVKGETSNTKSKVKADNAQFKKDENTYTAIKSSAKEVVSSVASAHRENEPDSSLLFSDTDDDLEKSTKHEEADVPASLESSPEELTSAAIYEPPELPDGVTDFDKEMLNDPSSEPHYAADIFNYYREQEVIHQVTKYLDKQSEISKHMRAILVDWIVEVQESFELNHETMYLAIKLVDHYLMKKPVTKHRLQLVGATAVFIACKYDERLPPVLDDFLYICDDAYTRRDVIEMEMDILKSLDFFLGFPLSYRFLRRYARCARLQMDTLTLARFVLETSLMDYDLIEERDSKLAAAALLLALKMKHINNWDATLEYYTGYCEDELQCLMKYLNKLISTQSKSLHCIRKKYSHKIFFEVAKIPPLAFEESKTQ